MHQDVGGFRLNIRRPGRAWDSRIGGFPIWDFKREGEQNIWASHAYGPLCCSKKRLKLIIGITTTKARNQISNI